MKEEESKKSIKPDKISNAERYSHINNISEEHTGESRYGSVEQTEDKAIINGVATVADTKGLILQVADRNQYKSVIQETVADSITDVIKKTEAETYLDQLKKNEKGKGGVLRTTVSVAEREIEKAIGQGGNDGDITSAAKGQGIKYGYKVGKYAVLATAGLGKKAYYVRRYAKKLSLDVEDGNTTIIQAKKDFTHQVTGVTFTEAGTSVMKVIAKDTVSGFEDFHGSDDLGMQALTKPKDIVVETNRSLKVARSTGKTLKGGIKGAKKIVQGIQKGGKYIVAAGKKLLANPIVLKGIGIVALVCAAIILVVSVISVIVDMFTTLAIKSDEWDLSQTYLYITELDARMEDDIINEDSRWHIPGIDVYTYYKNGVETTKDDMKVYTNADLVLAYLDSQYEDYVYDATILFELNVLHAQLHAVEKDRWTEEILHSEEDGSEWTEYIYHMDISLHTRSWEDFYNTVQNNLSTDQREQYNALLEAGVYSFRKELSSPFVGVDWSTGLSSSRWGWRIHPISGELKRHLGLDIGMPGGTPINACMSGIVEVPPYGYDYGNYVKISADEDYTLYAHMSSIAVTDGQNVQAGDVIGYVGTTGSSTGNHLHLEYIKNGYNLCPLIFTECEAAED